MIMMTQMPQVPADHMEDFMAMTAAVRNLPYHVAFQTLFASNFPWSPLPPFLGTACLPMLL